MTVDNARVVLDILTEEHDMMLYQYRHARTDAVLYALFPPWQVDDLCWAPDVREPELLYARGYWTEAGARWLTAERPAP